MVMNSLIIYLLGVSTPFVILFIYFLILDLKDYRGGVKYKKAYDEYTKEYNNLTPMQKSIFNSNKSWDETTYSMEQDRYFVYRFHRGRTKDSLIS